MRRLVRLVKIERAKTVISCHPETARGKHVEAVTTATASAAAHVSFVSLHKLPRGSSCVGLLPSTFHIYQALESLSSVSDGNAQLHVAGQNIWDAPQIIVQLDLISDFLHMHL